MSLVDSQQLSMASVQGSSSCRISQVTRSTRQLKSQDSRRKRQGLHESFLPLRSPDEARTPTTASASDQPGCGLAGDDPDHEWPDHVIMAIDIKDRDENPLPYRLEFRPSQDFGYDGALDKLANLPMFSAFEHSLQFLVPSEASNFLPGQNIEDFGTTNRPGKLSRLSICIDMESRISVGCLGAVYTWIQRKRASEYLQDDPSAELAYRVVEVKMFSLKGAMMVNSDTLLSLQIIQPESHPNAFNQGSGTSGSKESLSVYGLFHYLARTPQGKALLRQYFIRPSLDLDTINERLNFVSVFVKPENSLSLGKLSKSLSRIKNMRSSLTMLHRGVSCGNKKQGGFKSGVWASLLEFCYHTIDIAETLKKALGAETTALHAKALETLDTFQLQQIGKMVHDVVDLDSSIEQHRTVVRHGIDDRLDNVKTMYDSMEGLLSDAAAEVQRQIPGCIKVNVIYFPQLGFHITVPVCENTRVPVFNGGAQSWQRMFTTENQVYFKDARMHEMDEQLGDLYAMICDLEIEIAYDLAQRVLQDEKLLIAASDICGELDALFALAHGAIQYKLTRPNVTDANIIEVKAGRHLLQELCVPNYIANDAKIAGGRGRDGLRISEEHLGGPSMLLLTGPNFSGKSIFMKSIALITYLAHVGCFVPCYSAVIGLTDKILTCIASRETVSKDQSSFMLELQQVAKAIKQCTIRSLLVVDEFGKGTESCDGAGLASGMIRFLLDKPGADRPKTLVATHFHEIFEVGGGLPKLESYKHLGLTHMEVLLDESQSQEKNQCDRQVTYLYNLAEGWSNLSFGTQCAAMNGIPPAVVRRATQLADLSMRGEDLVKVCAAITKDEELEFHEAEDAARDFLVMDLSKGMEGNIIETLRRILGGQVENVDLRSERAEAISSCSSMS